MNLTALFRILFRWKIPALTVLSASLAVGTITALVWPLKYEAQVTIEQKPTKTSPTILPMEFDVTRLTSENQRTIAILKSRYFLEEWMKDIGIESSDTDDREKKLKKLNKSLVVKPVNFTDLYLIKVQAVSTEEAKRRATLLVDRYQEWDAREEQRQNKQVATLVKKRMDVIRYELKAAQKQIRKEKSSRALSLSGSTTEAEIQATIVANEKLLNVLAVEYEEAQRGMDSENFHRVKVIIPLVASDTPVHTRKLMLATVVAASFIFTFVIVLMLETQSQAIYRAGDVYRMNMPHPVVVFSRNDFGQKAGVLLEAIRDVVQAGGSAVVQISGSDDNQEQGVFVQTLHASLEAAGLRAFAMPLDQAAPFEARLAELRRQYQVVLLDLGAASGTILGTNLTSLADISCILLTSGRTSRTLLRMVESRLKTLPQQKHFFILTKASDPLPSFLRS